MLCSKLTVCSTWQIDSVQYMLCSKLTADSTGPAEINSIQYILCCRQYMLCSKLTAYSSALHQSCCISLPGDRCPPGHYCEAGTSTPQPCPPGYFQPSYSAQNLSWCVLCTSGTYCNQSGLDAPDGQCDAGR